MLAEFEKVQIVNVSNRNLVDHQMKGIEYASCFDMRHFISFLDVDRLDPVINSGRHNGVSIRLDYIHAGSCDFLTVNISTAQALLLESAG